MIERKAFSDKLYNECDSVAKKIACDFLLSTGEFELKTPLEKQYENFDFDFEIFFKGAHSIKIETEIKKVWTKSGVWQGWDTVDIPYRKVNNQADVFIMINKNLDTLALMKMEDVKASKTSKKNTTYTENETFFNVKLDKVKFFVKTKSGNWKLLK